MRVKYATKMQIKWAKSGDPGPNLGYDKELSFTNSHSELFNSRGNQGLRAPTEESLLILYCYGMFYFFCNLSLVTISN